jgi:hypothetical protein
MLPAVMPTIAPSSLLARVASVTCLGGLLACTPTGSAPGASASAVPGTAASAAAQATALPSGYYRIDPKSIADTCSPRQTSDGGRETFVSGKLIRGLGPVVNIPLVVIEHGRILPRLDLKLKVGETVKNTHALHAGGSAKATFQATLKEVRDDGFTVGVAQTWEGLEGDDGGTLGTRPLASCRAEEDLRFTLVRELCPARCNMDARVQPDGGVSGDCKCP